MSSVYSCDVHPDYLPFPSFMHHTWFHLMHTDMYLSFQLLVRIIHTHSILHPFLSTIYIFFVMPNEYFSDSQSRDSQSGSSQSEDSKCGPSAPALVNMGQTIHKAFEITQDDTSILQEYLQEFQQADTGIRTRMIEKVMAELYLLRAPNTPFDKMDASKVCGIHSSMIQLLTLCSRKYRNGSITITLALRATIPNLLASGLQGIPFIT